MHANNDQDLQGTAKKYFLYLLYVHAVTGILQH